MANRVTNSVIKRLIDREKDQENENQIVSKKSYNFTKRFIAIKKETKTALFLCLGISRLELKLQTLY